jgi:[protein-PII] uridylyltransferase
VLEMRQRHAKYEDTAFSLEPNCKESPGGLRDLQVILWLAKAAGLANSWRTLATSGLITQTEAKQLMEKERAFKDIRVRLHLHAGRREDRLVFDVQTAIAESLGLPPPAAAPHAPRQRIPDAALLLGRQDGHPAQHHPAAEHRSAPVPASGEAVRINERFNDVNGLIDIADDDTFEKTPSAMLEIFLLMTERPSLKGMTARTRARCGARFRSTPPSAPIRSTAAVPAHHAGAAASPRAAPHERPVDPGPLPAQLPQDRRPDAARPVPRLHGGPAHPDGGAQYAPLHHGRACARIPVLQPADGQLPALGAVLAALFHDIAKGRGGDHSKLGMADAERSAATTA